MLTAYAFVDGGYFRTEGKSKGIDFPNPHSTIEYVMSSHVREMGGYSPTVGSVFTRRMFFYDATDPASATPDPNIEKYWDEIERLHDTEVRFGALRGKPRRQKGVDVQLAVDMLVGAFDNLFDVAVLVSGDEDFVPLVVEVQRRGISVVVAAVTQSASAELRRVADRYIDLSEEGCWAFTKAPFVIPPSP
jgi:hypothetical protein